MSDGTDQDGDSGPDWETCGATKSDGDPCELAAGWGTENDSGACRHHGGCGGDPNGKASAAGRKHGHKGGDVGDPGGAPEGNTNGVRHGLYADTNKFYTRIADDQTRALIDGVFNDYLERYVEQHGDPPLGHEAELFEIAVALGKEIHAHNWAADKPDELESGNALVDREVRYNETGQRYFKYKEAIPEGTIKKLSGRRRQWLKEMGLLPGSGDAGPADMGDLGRILMENLRESYEK